MGRVAKPADQEAQKKLERAVAILQDCGKVITIRQLWRILASIRVRYVLACLALLGGLASGGFTLGLKWPRAPVEKSAPERQRIEGLLEFDATYAHTDRSKWMVALVRYLDTSGHFVARIDTKSFASWSTGFRLRVEPNVPGNVVGVAFKLRPAEPEPFLQQLTIRQTDSYLEVVVPPCDKEERLVLILRLQRPPHEAAIDLTRIVTLRVAA